MSLRARRKLVPWIFVGPGLIWLVIFYVIPLINQINVSLQTGDPDSGFALTWHFGTYIDVLKTTRRSSCARSATRRRRRSST